MDDLVLAIDQGTTGSQAALFRADSLELLCTTKADFPQHYPRPGWVEHNLEEIWHSVNEALAQTLRQAETAVSSPQKRIIAVGITNQRETVAAWNRSSGECLSPAIVWQDRRTSDFCALLRSDQALKEQIENVTGLVIDPYFSATKMAWLLKNNQTVASLAGRDQLSFGTIDSFLIHRLSGRVAHVTDHTNASRTMMYGLARGDFDDSLLSIFGVSRSSLPRLVPSAGHLAVTKGHPLLPDGIPIMSCLGDQQAALYGHLCQSPGQGKITFGTGSFLLSHIGNNPVKPPPGLLCSVAFSTDSERSFALEGSIFVAASALNYLRDQFGWISDAAESESLALSAPRDPHVLVIPAFTGLGAPHWNPHVKAAIVGLSLGTSKAQVVRAMLESIALQNVPLVKLMSNASARPITHLGIDGGASKNKFLMQFQADLLRATLVRPVHSEITALGAARAALRALGHPGSNVVPPAAQTYVPVMDEPSAVSISKRWQQAVEAMSALYAGPHE